MSSSAAGDVVQRRERRDFVLASAATFGATLFSNPFDVCKTRLQLQGQLGVGFRAYHGMDSILRDVFSHEGIRGFQKGLLPSVAHQIVLNGTRLYPAPYKH